MKWWVSILFFIYKFSLSKDLSEKKKPLIFTNRASCSNVETGHGYLSLGLFLRVYYGWLILRFVFVCVEDCCFLYVLKVLSLSDFVILRSFQSMGIALCDFCFFLLSRNRPINVGHRWNSMLLSSKLLGIPIFDCVRCHTSCVWRSN